MKRIEKAMHELIGVKPFYAHFFLNCKIEYDYPGVPTAAAAITKDAAKLYFNTKFMDSLSTKEVCAVVEHEILHLLFRHPIELIQNGSLDKMTANVAMDMSINQWIENCPEGGVSHKDFDLEPGQHWEYYYSKLLGKDLSMFENFDSHEFWDNEVLKRPDQAKSIIADVAGKAIKASAGNVPSEILKQYNNLTESKVVWQQILSNFVARATDVEKLNTRKKPNRRFGYRQPGHKKKRTLTLGVCVDSSGSISDESYQQFMSELTRIVKYCGKTYFIEADCVVHNVDTIKKNGKFELKRRSCGGTAYQPAINKCMELNCDAIVYFGDGDCADKPSNPGVPFLWALVGGSPKPGDFGGEIRLSETQETN